MYRLIILLLIFLWSVNVYGQFHHNNSYNDSINNIFYKIIKSNYKKDKNIAIIVYDLNFDLIINKSAINYLNNKNDSLAFLNYIKNNDSLFNMYYLVNRLAQDKAVYYKYEDPKTCYNKSYADNFDYIDERTRLNYNAFDLYIAVFHFKKKHKKISNIEPLGIIAYTPSYDPNNGAYSGKVGIGCFVFKNKKNNKKKSLNE